jgi:hypothetical protein
LKGFFFVIGVACSQACLEESGQACSVRRLFLKTPFLTKRVFCFYVFWGTDYKSALSVLIVLQYNPSSIAVGEVTAPEGTTTEHTTTR